MPDTPTQATMGRGRYQLQFPGRDPVTVTTGTTLDKTLPNQGEDCQTALTLLGNSRENIITQSCQPANLPACVNTIVHSTASQEPAE